MIMAVSIVMIAQSVKAEGKIMEEQITPNQAGNDILACLALAASLACHVKANMYRYLDNRMSENGM